MYQYKTLSNGIKVVAEKIDYLKSISIGVWVGNGSRYENKEVKDAKRAIKILGGQIEDIVEAEIPFTELKHKIIVIKKVGQTPLKYPRKPGIATKTPIGTCYNLVK